MDDQKGSNIKITKDIVIGMIIAVAMIMGVVGAYLVSREGK